MMVLYIVTSFMKISRKVSELLSGHDFPTKIFKDDSSVKNVGRVTVLVLCTSHDDALYLYLFS